MMKEAAVPAQMALELTPSCGTMTGWCQLAEQFCSRSAQRAQRVVGHAEGVFDGLGLGDEFRFQRARYDEAALICRRQGQAELAAISPQRSL